MLTTKFNKFALSTKVPYWNIINLCVFFFFSGCQYLLSQKYKKHSYIRNDYNKQNPSYIIQHTYSYHLSAAMCRGSSNNSNNNANVFHTLFISMLLCKNSDKA